jgi:hypothetical protein
MLTCRSCCGVNITPANAQAAVLAPFGTHMLRISAVNLLKLIKSNKISALEKT